MRNAVVVASTLVVALIIGAAACSSDEEASSSQPTPDGGRSSGSSSGVNVDGSSACKQNEKLCGDKCVGFDDPKTGCGGDLCDPCSAPTGANTVPACLAGICKPGCADGFGDCNKNADDGCETPVSANLTSCGKCGNVCGAAHGASAPKCAGGKCAFTCEAGWKACGPDAEGCNKNVDSDPKNCGACGRDCLGGTCSARQCSVIPLATGQPTPFALAIDASNVYFVTGGSLGGKLMRMTKDGSGLVDGLAGATLNDPHALVTDGQRLFWANFDQNGPVKIQRANLNGSGIADVGESFKTYAMGLAVSGNTVAWTNRGGTNRVMRAPAAGGAAAIVATGPLEAVGVAVDATHVYWGTGSGLHRQPISAAAPCTIGTDCPVLSPVEAFAVAVDANNVYFTQGVGTVNRIPKGGGTGVPIATNQFGVSVLAIDATHAYWGTPDGIRRTLLGAATPCDGPSCELVVAFAAPIDMVLDDKAIYWTEFGGNVNKRAK